MSEQTVQNEEHTNPIKSPKQLIAVVGLSFLVPVIAIILLVRLVDTTPRIGYGSDAMSHEAIAARIAPVALYNVTIVAEAEETGPKQLLTGEALYNKLCMACHDAGVAGAPKMGDSAAWAPRIAQGEDTLFKHSLEGFNAMPAKGGDTSLDDIEVKRAVVYMVNKSGGSLTEPEAPAAQ
ncbi:MAG: cytochrome c5 family protein [Alcaligenaceae bacterium]|nr:cytochrome c5 family protein [Alcaligenaceae bacterium]